MPLVRFEVRNEYGLGDPELYLGAARREEPKAVLDGVAVAGLVGILRQLGDLAEFAADVFQDLHEQVTATATRGRKMLTRIQRIEAALPSLEQAVQGQTSHIHFAYVPACDWHAHLQNEQSYLLSSELPRFMMDSYEECRDPPRLYLLDKFDSAGAGSCLKRYSDPSYFKRVWAMSEQGKAENHRREQKAQKNKRKGSRLRNGEAHYSIAISRRNSSFASSTQFASPSMDGHSSSTENTSVRGMTPNLELASQSTSIDAKTRLSYVEPVNVKKTSAVPDELEYDQGSNSRLHIGQSGSPASVLHNEANADAADDDSHHNLLQEISVPRSPSVTWDEKTEIVKPVSPISCDDILVDTVQVSESLSTNSEPPHMDDETTKIEVLDQEGILYDVAKKPISICGAAHFDEVTSETDNYVDALNTLESETETETECQTKREVKPLSNFNSQGMEYGDEKMQEMIARNPDSFDIDGPIASYDTLNQDVAANSILASPDDSECKESPRITDFAPNPEYSAVDEFSENNALDMSRKNGYEHVDGDLSRERSSPVLQMSGDETTTKTSMPHSPLSDTSAVPSIKLWTNAGLFGLEPSKPPDLGAPNIASDNAAAHLDNSTRDLSSRTVMTGSAAKSDAVDVPDGSMSKSSSTVEKLNGITSTLSSLDQTSSSGDQLFSSVYNTMQPNDPSEYLQLRHDNQHNDTSFKKNSQVSKPSLSVNGLNKTQGVVCNSLCANSDGPDLAKTSVASGAELPAKNSVGSQYSELGQNVKGVSSSLSGLAQRFLSNTLQRNAITVHSDISKPSVVDNTGGERTQWASILPNQNDRPTGAASQTSYEQNNKDKIANGSLKKSITSESHYSGQSSPPLEHMKISFNPMNGLESSNLKLEFSEDSLHESIEDSMFPSFQLLPQTAVPLPDSGSESDDDTFCRSCPYSSEDLSPRSYSNSELWEHDDRSGSRSQQLYDDSHKISPSTTSVSSYMGLDQMNLSSIDPTGGFGYFGAENGSVSFHSGPLLDLPGLDSVISLKNQKERSACLLDDPTNFVLQTPHLLPPPPPLPPMQWRVIKPSCTSGEDKGSHIADVVDQLDGLQALKITPFQQQEQNTATPQCISEAMAPHPCDKTRDQRLNGDMLPNHGAYSKDLNAREELFHQIRSKHDQQKQPEEPQSQSSASRELDEREDFLHQIRNKTFNLRRTATSKPSTTSQPAANDKVVAILEKANAIRQACVGSDEGGEDDSWTDG